MKSAQKRRRRAPPPALRPTPAASSCDRRRPAPASLSTAAIAGGRRRRSGIPRAALIASASSPARKTGSPLRWRNETSNTELNGAHRAKRSEFSVGSVISVFNVREMQAILALENGTFYRGVAAGAEGEARGEVVFNTSMTGYQEVLTDPSYAGQIVTMTCPEIGNYGVSPNDVESRRPQVAGFIIRDESPISSNWRAQMTLREYLVANKIVAISDIDTRALTRRLRSSGVMRGVIATGNALDPAALIERARSLPTMEGSDLVRDVTCREPFDWPQEDPDEFGTAIARRTHLGGRRLK